jgi:hypothetical protein
VSSAPPRFETVERAIAAAIPGLISQGRATRSMRRTVPKKRWSSLKMLGRECEGQFIRIQGLPSLFFNVHRIEAAAFW